MYADFLAGTVHSPVVVPRRSPSILAFDSGLGGLTVYKEMVRIRPEADFIYAADDAAFPYGALSEAELVTRVGAVMERLISAHRPDIVVVACNTASTLVLPHLRRSFPLPFVGTVPAIKPAAAASRTKRISILATPGTVARDYTRGLIETYASECRVELVGSKRLAGFAEAELTGAPVPDQEVAAEIAPCFVEDGAGRTDVVVLACTHYPLLLPRFRRLAPWSVDWIDPAPAIARRMSHVLSGGDTTGDPPDGSRLAVFTGPHAADPVLAAALMARGFNSIQADPFPLPVRRR